MFSLADVPVQLDGISFAETGPAARFSHLHGEVADFSKVLGELQVLKGEVSPGQLAENPEMLKDLGLSSDHLKMLQSLLADGKSLPEAAQAVLLDLKQQLAELLRREPSLAQLEQIEALQEEAVELFKLFPQELRAEPESELQELQNITSYLRQELDNLARQVSSKDNSDSQQDTSDTEHADHNADSEKTLAIDTMQNEAQASEDVAVAAAMLSQSQNDSHALNKKAGMDETAKAVAAMQSSANKSGHGKGAAFLGNDNLPADTEYDLRSEGKPLAENRVMPNLPSQQAAGRIAQLQVNDQAMAQAITKFSGQGTGSNLPSAGNNASYTQLMTQSMPSPVTQNIHKPEWGNAIGQRITWMIGNNLQGAQLRISPAHLGPVDIKLSIESGVAQVSFVSNHQVVRDALEQAVPRLRDMLENQNLELGDVDISDRSLADSSSMQSEFANAGNESVASDHEPQQGSDSDDQTVVHELQSDNLLDAYA